MINNIKDYSQYYALIVFIITAFILCAVMLVAGWLLGSRSRGRYKDTPFESGIESCGDTHIRFYVKFYLIAVFFVIFDVESIFLYAWSTAIHEIGWMGFLESSIFILMLLIGLLYLVRIGAMNWTPKHRIVTRK